MTNFLKRRITKDESRDTGMALVLLALILFLYSKRNGFLATAVVLHLVNMIAPAVFRWPAVLWLGLSQALSAVMSKVLMSVVFFGVVTPVAAIRRLMGRDSLQLRTFKASSESVMVARNHRFTARDLERPY